MVEDLLIRDITCACRRVKGTILGSGSKPCTGFKCECSLEFVNGEERTVLVDSVSLRRGR